MHALYQLAMGFRITGIILSTASLSLSIFKPFEPITNTLAMYLLLVMGALLIVIGQIIVIRFVPDEEIVNAQQKREAVYDVLTTSFVIALFIAIYFVPFVYKYVLSVDF